MNASDTENAAAGSLNVVALRGVVATEVRISDLPAGGRVHNFEVKTGRGPDRHVVPIAWHDPSRPPRLTVGDEVVVVGAVRRRWFRAGGGSQSRTEVLADVVTKSGSARAAKVLTAAAAEVADGGRENAEG